MIKNKDYKAIRECRMRELNILFTNNVAVQFINKNNGNRKAIFHKCTKGNGNVYQVSFIDNLGAEMDIAADTLENIINEFMRFYPRYNIIDEVVTC